MPQTWAPLLPASTDLECDYVAARSRLTDCLESCTTTDELDCAFQTWAEVVETAVDVAVQRAHTADPLECTAKHLPRAARGRCCYRPLQSKPLPRSAPSARHGDYQPPEEAITVVARG